MFTQVVDVCDWVRLRIDWKASVRVSSIVREGGMHINLKKTKTFATFKIWEMANARALSHI